MSGPASLLSSSYRRRQFFVFTALALLALGFARFYLLPTLFGARPVSWIDILGALLDSFIVALAASGATLAFLSWITPPAVRRARLRVVEPGDLKRTLRDALKGTREFWYRGHTARWTRSVTLPFLAAQAREEKSAVEVYLIISDPNDARVCRTYAEFGHQRRPGDQEKPWDPRRVQQELYATILSAYVWMAEEPLLTVSVALSSQATLFRVDLSSSAVVITTPYPRDPAMLAVSASSLYKSFREDLRVTFQQCRVLPRDRIAPRRVNLTQPVVSELLQMLGFDSASLTPEDLGTILKTVQQPASPYPD